MKHRHIALLAPVAALALAVTLSACGSDETSDVAGEATTGSVAAAVETTEGATPMEGTTAMEGTAATEGTTAGTTPMGGTAAVMPGGEATVGDLTVNDVWVRQPASGQTTSATYGMITNNGDTDVTLVAASVPFDATVEIHETIAGDDGTMMMQEVPEGFVVPAGGTFALEPGGAHIMMLDVDPADIAGTVDVTMVFDDGSGSQIEVTVTAPVRPLDMGSGMGDTSGDMTGTTMPG